MQADPKLRRAREEEAVERAILALILAGFPMLRTFPELAREIGDRDAAERALCALADCGLVQFNGVSESIQPTLAARRCHLLDSW